MISAFKEQYVYAAHNSKCISALVSEFAHIWQQPKIDANEPLCHIDAIRAVGEAPPESHTSDG